MRIFTSFIPITTNYNIPENMAENQRKEIKMENIDIIDVIRPSSTIEETCAVYIKEEDVKVEISEPYQGKIIKGNLNINIKFSCIENFPTRVLDTFEVMCRNLKLKKNIIY